MMATIYIEPVLPHMTSDEVDAAIGGGGFDGIVKALRAKLSNAVPPVLDPNTIPSVDAVVKKARALLSGHRNRVGIPMDDVMGQADALVIASQLHAEAVLLMRRWFDLNRTPGPEPGPTYPSL